MRYLHLFELPIAGPKLKWLKASVSICTEHDARPSEAAASKPLFYSEAV
jgi:hypothetical protein